MDNIIELKNISKTFPGVKALDNVDLKIKKGDVHAIVGENGAGKSTLMKILNGNFKKDSGTILFEGQEVDITSPNVAREIGISIIFQELNLVPVYTVAENIYMGRQKEKSEKIINWNKIYKNADLLLKKIGYEIDPKRLVKTLSVAEKQMVEIAKALSYNAKIILMDEPSATLTQSELKMLFNIIKSLKSKGITVIYISHRLEEIFEICETVTVMRDGKVIDTTKVKDTNKEEIIRKMVARDITDVLPKRNAVIGEEVLYVKSLKTKEISNVSFSLHKGEILGIAGLVGAGRTEMVRALFGVDFTEQSEILINGRKVKINSPIDAIKNGMAFVTEERKEEGLILEFDVKANITMTVIKDLIEKVFVSRKKEKDIVNKTVKDLSIKISSANQMVMDLSGGNQQKVVLGKWLNTNANIFILDEPTRGIDVGAKQEVYNLMNKIVESGNSIIFISSELQEVIGMSDRVLVMHEGMIKGELTGKDISAENVLYYALKGREA